MASHTILSALSPHQSSAELPLQPERSSTPSSEATGGRPPLFPDINGLPPRVSQEVATVAAVLPGPEDEASSDSFPFLCFSTSSNSMTMENEVERADQEEAELPRLE